MRMARARIDGRARVQLPRDVLVALEVLPGDDIYFVIHGNHIIVTTEPEDYAPYLLDGNRAGTEYADRPSLPEDWHGWEEWDEETRR